MNNLPNKITLIRIALLPLILFFFLASFIPFGKLIAFILFLIACITDLLDGYIARKYNLVTDFGIFLDPIADKLLASTGLLLILVDGVIPPVYGVIFFFVMLQRDYVVTGLRQIAQLKGKIIMADKVAKIKANFLYFTLNISMFFAFLKTIVTSVEFLNVCSIIIYVFVGITMALIIVSEVVYLVNNYKVFLDEKKIEKEDKKIV